MNLREKSESIAVDLGKANGEVNVVMIDPVTITIILTILQQAVKLLRWWKPEWFLSWQIDRIIETEVAGSQLSEKRDKLKELILSELKDS